MKIGIWCDELYPFYTLEKDAKAWTHQVEIDRDLYNRYKKNIQEFKKIQIELEKTVESIQA